MAGIPEDLHPFLRPFIVYSDGSTTLPVDFSIGAPECEGYGLGSLDRHDHGAGILGRLAAGISEMARSMGPAPLFARRLHGGLNTTVYNTRKTAPPPDGEFAPAFDTGTDSYVLEFGAILDVDPSASVASVPNGEVGVPTGILIEARNGLGEPFPFGGDLVVIDISGANTATPTVEDNGDGTYSASYTPAEAGQDILTITINGYEISGSPYATQVVGYGSVSVAATVEGDPISGVQVVLYDQSSQVASAATDESGQASFEDLLYGTYTVQAAGGYDINVQFVQESQSFDLASPSVAVALTGATRELPANVRVWSLSEGGNGNAYHYVRGNIAWADASVSAQQTVLWGVNGHLATITSGGENAFVNGLRFVGVPDGVQPTVGFNPYDMRAWIGLTDQAQEGVFLWITGEPFDFANWGAGEPSNGGFTGQPAEEFVEMFASGVWNDISSPNYVNQGYVVEWDASGVYPDSLF